MLEVMLFWYSYINLLATVIMTYYTITKDSVKRPMAQVKGLLLQLVQSWCQKTYSHGSRGTCAKLVSKESIHTVNEALVQSWCQKNLFTQLMRHLSKAGVKRIYSQGSVSKDLFTRFKRYLCKAGVKGSFGTQLI